LFLSRNPEFSLNGPEGIHLKPGWTTPKYLGKPVDGIQLNASSTGVHKLDWRGLELMEWHRTTGFHLANFVVASKAHASLAAEDARWR